MAEGIKKLTDETFGEAIKQGIVLVDFYADWCGPCRMLTPIIESLAKEMAGQIVVAKVDTDGAVNVATQFDVTSIPTVILFKNGQPIKRVVGLKDIDFFRNMVKSAL
jgi:thioredoxin 1